MRKIAVAIIHGAGIHQRGKDDLNNMIAMQALLERKFLEKTDQNALQFELIYWDQNSLLQKHEDDLRATLAESGVRFRKLDPTGTAREFLYDRVSDLIAYQPVMDPTLIDESAYVVIHKAIAQGLAALAHDAGSHTPLCVIAHSLGTVIASNYIYDLQKNTPDHPLILPPVAAVMGNTPLECGETLRCLFTMGSPMALWRLRSGTLAKPIDIPCWINLFDTDDIIAYPLEKLFEKDHGRKVVQDIEVETGWVLDAHTGYWHNEAVLEVIVDELVEIWNSGNGDSWHDDTTF